MPSVNLSPKVVGTLVIVALALFSFGGLTLAQPGSEAALEALVNNPKIRSPESALRDFKEGKETTPIIIVLVPPASVLEFGGGVLDQKSSPADRATAYTSELIKRPDARKELRKEVETLQGEVLGPLDPAHVRVRHKFSHIFGFSAEVTPQGLQNLANNPKVLSIEEDTLVYPHLAQGIPLMKAGNSRRHHDGSGLSIAIVDTGIDSSHPRLGGGGFPNSKVIGGYDFGDNDSDPRPSLTSGEAHGTNCAGIAAGDVGILHDYIGGVAPGARLYALKITSGDSGSAYTSSIAAAWDWCVTHQNDNPGNPIMIISTSFGGGRYYSTCDGSSTSLAQAASNAAAAGITVFVSSGNDGYCDSLSSPACLSNVISVGAVYDSAFGDYYPCVNARSCASKYSTTGCTTGYYADDSTAADKVASYSNTASFLSLLAPANSVYTTDITGSGGYSSSDYYSGFGGTSAACPYAAGAAALLQSSAKADSGSFLTPAQVKQTLIDNGDAITDGKVSIIKPRVNIGKVSAETVDWSNILDISGLTFTSGGDVPWDYDTSIRYYGSGSAISGMIGNGQTSWLQTTITGPTGLSFYWRVSSEQNYDYLTVYLDGVWSSRISGTVDWQQQTINIPSGGHTVRWVYSKDVSEIAGSDCGWIDKISSSSATADLSVTLTDSPDPVIVNSNFVYTVGVTNSGPGAAEGVTVVDTLPAGVTFVSASVGQGSSNYSSGTVTWTVGSLGSGAGSTATIVVKPAAAGTVVNTATVSGSTTDPNSANNSASTSTTVNAAADLSITISDSPDPVTVNSNLTYGISVTNSGPSAATGVRITDPLPAGATFVSASASQGSCSNSSGTVTCNIGSLASGASIAATIAIKPTVAGTIVNTATVSGSTTDPNSANNSASTSTTVSARPTVTSFSINGNAAFTTALQVTLNNTVTGGTPTHYMASEVSSFTKAAWQTYSTSPSFTLSSGVGNKTVYFKVKNSSGAESDVVSDSIQLKPGTDLTALLSLLLSDEPTSAVTSFKIDNGARFTTSLVVTLDNKVTGSAPTHYIASELSTFEDAEWFEYSGSPPFTLSSGTGTKTVYFKVRNSSGVESSVAGCSIEVK